MGAKQLSLALVFLMLTLPLTTFVMEHDEGASSHGLWEAPEIELIRIESDPMSVRGISPSNPVNGVEKIRPTYSETRLGTYDELGLRLSQTIPETLSSPRADVRLVLIDGEQGLWPAQESISEISGIVIRAYIPPSGFLIQGEPRDFEALVRLPEVVAVHEVPKAMFVADELLYPLGNEALVRIEGWRSIDSGLPQDSLTIGDYTWKVSNLVQEVSEVVDVLDAGRYEVIVQAVDLPTLAGHPSVSWIRVPPEFAPHNDNSRSHMQVANVVTSFATELNGSGEIVAIADSGIDQDHGDMNNRVVDAVSVVSGDSSTEDTHGGHGTHVACTVLGDGNRGGYAGVAPEAETYFQAMERDSDGQFYSPSMNYLLNSAYNNGARTHTNSWGSQTGNGQYTSDSVDVDDRTFLYDQYWSYEGLTVLFSAGNEGNGAGTISPPATAKNQVAVGNHHNRGGGAPDTLASSSSRGPTDDGRLKPDVSAPGSWVRSCRSQEATDMSQASWTSQWYAEFSGTSMAAPNAAGASALIREYLTEVAMRPEPQGALVKGMLILGAEDMGTRNIPNNDEGWGRVNLARSLAQLGDTGVWVDDRNSLGSGQSRDYSFNLTHGWQQLKVVLTWSDYRGSTWASSQLVNDLDLTVISPDGTTTYLGNVFSNGRSSTGGSADDVNNVEVVLVDQAQKGIWTVRVENSRHGGQTSTQHYALAIRGAGVDDLSPDATAVPGSFQLSDPIPQVGSEVIFSAQISNQGSRVMENLAVKATAAGQALGQQLITLGPGETRGVTWEWTPASSGNHDIVIRADPDDVFEELDEANNVLIEPVGVTEPGVKVTAQNLIKTVSNPEANVANWNLILSNTALIPTNATISASKPVRLSDGQEFNDWFQSFSQTSFELNGSESVQIGLTLVHPAPPEPGVYQFTVTGEDIDNSIEYPITLTLDVPVLPNLRMVKGVGATTVSPLENTSFSLTLHNEGNGLQGWDLTLDSPAGWHLGFETLGSMYATPSASSGLISASSSKVVPIVVVPPSDTMVSAGVNLQGAITAVSQIDSEKVWTETFDFVVSENRAGSIVNESSYGTLRPDSQLNLRFQISNDGNVDLELSPTVELPGGWDVVNQLPQMILEPEESKNIVVAIKGNGLAASGPITVLMVDQNGDRLEWTGYLEVQSAPRPSLTFAEIVLSDGTRSPSVLGTGDHPVGLPGFQLVWYISNDGAQPWKPSTTLVMPSSEWTGLCDQVGTIQPSEGEYLTCQVIVPIGTIAGEEPSITLRANIDDVQVQDTVTLRVATTKAVIWGELETEGEFLEGASTEFTIDLSNEGNTPLSHRIEASGPSDWNVEITNLDMVEIQPGETRTIRLSITADSPGVGTIDVRLANADDVSGAVKKAELTAQDDPNRSPSSSGDSLVLMFVVLLIIAGLGAVALVVLRKRPESSSLATSLPPPPMAPQAEQLPSPPSDGGFGAYPLPPPPSAAPAASAFTSKEENLPPPPSGDEVDESTAEEESSEGDGGDPNHKCWVCIQPLPETGWQACPTCGARYHSNDSKCGIGALEKCRNCEGEIEAFVQV